MKKYLYLFLVSTFISLSAQNFIVGGKYTNVYNKNLNAVKSFEFLIATNDSAYSIGLQLGFTSIKFNYDNYSWVYDNETQNKSISGIIAYLYPLKKVGGSFIKPLYISLLWANISNSTIGNSPGMVADETGNLFPNSINDKILSFSIGYKLRGEVISFLLGVGYQYRNYDLRFEEYINGYEVKTHIIPQKEEAFQFDIGLQYIF